MTATANLPTTAPFEADDIAALNKVVSRSTPLQRSWLAGFLAGLDASGSSHAQAVPANRPRAKLTILYASESGNAEGLALKARKLAQKLGFDARVLDMAEADLSALPKADNLIVYAATWGEGDPPQRAADFFASLMADGAPRLEGVRFAVVALGDTAYVNFCTTGRNIDERLAALGATRAASRVDLDLDFAKKAAEWTETTLMALAPVAEPSATVVRVDFKSGAVESDSDEAAFYQSRPLEAEITEAINLNGTGSSAETWHLELATDTAGYHYEPGDAIGVVAENDPVLAAELADRVGLSGNKELVRRLITDFDITTLSRPVIELLSRLTGEKAVAGLAAPERFADYARDRQLIDLLSEHAGNLTADQLTGLLRPLPPRLYSVASSLKAHQGETHLLVSAVRWASHGRDRKGVASTFIADRRKKGDTLKVYVKANRHFRLPNDPQRPIIMICAGTGVAPFRAFVEERAEAGAKGKSWLFFGARNYTNDFLYQLDWQDHLKSGALSNIDLAFSRDQPEKIYVQHRLLEQREELRRWIADGAAIYVCGDEKGMARDVDAALVQILAEVSGGDQAAGHAKLKDLAKTGLYLRDVY